MIRLEPLTMNHLPHVMTWANDPEVMGYFASHQEPITEEEERKYLAKILDSPMDRVWSIFHSETGEYLGQCSINAIYWPARNGRIFMALCRAAHGKGYASSILKALQDKAWEMGLHKLWLIVREENEKARKKYERAGFLIEGVLRDEYYVKGRYYNMVRMGCLNPHGV